MPRQDLEGRNDLISSARFRSGTTRRTISRSRGAENSMSRRYRDLAAAENLTKKSENYFTVENGMEIERAFRKI